MTGIHALVLCGGELTGLPAVPVTPADLIIAADSGLSWAEILGVHPDIAVGDFDSVPEELLGAYEKSGTRISRYPVVKDSTDLELALRVALDAGTSRVTVVGGGGGRLDHQLGNLMLLAHTDFSGVELTAEIIPARVSVVHDSRELSGRPGDLVSLFPVGGRATGVTTEGLAFSLEGAHLDVGSTRGVSNAFVLNTAIVRIQTGVLLAIQPDFHRRAT